METFFNEFTTIKYMQPTGSCTPLGYCLHFLFFMNYKTIHAYSHGEMSLVPCFWGRHDCLTQTDLHVQNFKKSFHCKVREGKLYLAWVAHSALRLISRGDLD